MGNFKLSENKKILLGYDGKCPDEITIPDGIEIIEKDAFAGKENLKKVKFNSSIKTIKSGAFAKTGIQTVSLPASVSSLSKDSFSYMTMGRQKYGQPYKTPTTLKVDKKNACYYTDEKCLYEIQGDELILVLCFKGSCSSLDVATGTVRIKKGAFEYCKYLTSISLPDTLVTLDDGVFKNLELTSLKLPAKTTDIGKSEFSCLIDNLYESYSYYDSGKSRSTKIIVDKDNPAYASSDNCFIKRNGKEATLLHVFDKYQEEFIVPDFVTHISQGAFLEYTKLKKLKFSKNLKCISAEAFKRCISLEEITIPACLETIESEAFANCTKLRDVVFKGGNVNISDTAFDGCKKGQLLFNCPQNSKVEEYAKLKKINLAGAKKSDNPSNAFTYTISKNKTVKISAYVSRDNKVVIPGTIEGCPVVAFNKDIFKNNKKIISVVWPAEIPVLPKEIFFGCSSLKEVVLPDGLTEISEKSFRNCEALTKISIPATVSVIHEKAFECAKNTPWGWEYWNCVQTITGSSDSYAAKFAKNAGIKFISEGCSAEEQEAISKYSFHEVSDGVALDDFVITDDMPMSKSGFGGPRLISFEIPNEILGKPVVELSVDFHKKAKQTGTREIEYENIAETLVVSENLKRIRCPLYRRGIQTVTISPKNTSIVFDDYAWYEDEGQTLGSIWVNSDYNINEYTIRDGAIRACSELKQAFSLEKLFFPESFAETYEGFLMNGSWSNVRKIYANKSSCMKEYAEKNMIKFVALDSQDIVFSEDGLVLISCPQLFDVKKYAIPDGVKQIEKYAFKYNEQIEEIIVPESVETIGEGAFSKCMSLKKVALPSNMAELPNELFYESKNLSSVKWPDNVTKIGKKCFADTALKKVAIPEGVVEIGDYAFATTGWSANLIESIEVPKSVQKIGISICAGIKDITVYDSIDPDAKPAKDFYDDANGDWNSRVGCIGIRQYENYAWAACNSDVYKHTITVKSAVDSSIKYKVLMYGKEEARNVYCAMVSSWGKNAEFDFTRIDEKFSELSDADNRLETVLNRFAYPIDLTEDAKNKYLAWLKRNSATIVGEFIEKGDLTGLISYEKYGIITKNNIQKLIDLAVSKNKVEISAYLLEYKTKL